MKKCPKCNKQYDDTWDVCLGCSVKLQEVNSDESLVKQCVEDAKNEIRNIRTDIGTLQQRVDVLERDLTREKLMEKIEQARKDYFLILSMKKEKN